ncbi:MAG: glycosyltransferase, partial [Candidatus Binatia bacterium]
MDISIIVPALDEATQIAAALASARAPGVCEVIVVDGGSADDTVAIAAACGARVLD